jgi:molybdenum cofactor synthesis domain-containing protein
VQASKGEYTDESGPEIVKLLTKASEEMKPDTEAFAWTLNANVCLTACVPDDVEAIQRVVTEWIDVQGVDCVLTTGGTGFGRRDITPEAITPLLHRQAPGVAQALLNEGLQYTPLAVLSRPVVGTRHNTLVATLPGR